MENNDIDSTNKRNKKRASKEKKTNKKCLDISEIIIVEEKEQVIEIIKTKIEEVEEIVEQVIEIVETKIEVEEPIVEKIVIETKIEEIVEEENIFSPRFDINMNNTDIPNDFQTSENIEQPKHVSYTTKLKNRINNFFGKFW